MSHLRYKPGTDQAARWPSIRYPWHAEVTREQAERMRAAMPDPEAFEIVAEGD